jgi:cytochrome bd-type quinol oxidase subunit 2
MLTGLIFRGVAFEYRIVPGSQTWFWNAGFHWGSVLAAFSQGIMLGAFVEGFSVSGRAFSGSSLDWLHPFPLVSGVALVFGYGLLGAGWLVLKTEGELQSWARQQGDDKVFLGQLDGTFVALDIKTGKEVWRTQLARWQDGYTITAAPLFQRRDLFRHFGRRPTGAGFPRGA